MCFLFAGRKATFRSDQKAKLYSHGVLKYLLVDLQSINSVSNYLNFTGELECTIYIFQVAQDQVKEHNVTELLGSLGSLTYQVENF